MAQAKDIAIATTPLTPAALDHIVLDPRGVAWVKDTNTKVREIVLGKIAYDFGPEEIHREHPHLSLAQIHAAFTYYYDHKAEVDAEIEAGLELADRLRAEAGDTPIHKKLRELGHLK